MAKTQSIWTADFWRGTAERAIMTFFQALFALIGVDTVSPIWGLDWTHLVGAAGTAALLSVAKSLGAGAATGTPSVGHLEEPAKRAQVRPQGTEQGM